MDHSRDRQRLLASVEHFEADWDALLIMVSRARSEASKSARRAAASHASFLSALVKALDRAVPPRDGHNARPTVEEAMPAFRVWQEVAAAMRAFAPGLKVSSSLQIEGYAYNLLGRAYDYGAHVVVVRTSAEILAALLFDSKMARAQVLFNVEYPLQRAGKENQRDSPSGKGQIGDLLNCAKQIASQKDSTRSTGDIDLIVNTLLMRMMCLLDLSRETDVHTIQLIRVAVEAVMDPMLLSYPASHTRTKHLGGIRRLLLRGASKLMGCEFPTETALLESLRCRCGALRWMANTAPGRRTEFDAQTFADLAHKAVISAERRAPAAGKNQHAFRATLVRAHSDNFEIFIANATEEDWGLESVAAWFDHQIALLAKQGAWDSIQSLKTHYLDRLAVLQRTDLSLAVELQILSASFVENKEDNLESLASLLHKVYKIDMKDDASSHLRFIRVLEPARRILCAWREIRVDLERHAVQVLETLTSLTSEGLSLSSPGTLTHEKLEKATPPYLESLKALLNLYAKEAIENPEVVTDLGIKIHTTVGTTESTLATLVSSDGEVPCVWAKWLGLLLYDLGRFLRHGERTQVLAAQLLERSAYWSERTGSDSRGLLLTSCQTAGLLYALNGRSSEALECMFQIFRSAEHEKANSSSDTLRLVGECVLNDPLAVVNRLCDGFGDEDESGLEGHIAKLIACVARYENRLNPREALLFYKKQFLLLETILELAILSDEVLIRVLLDQLRIHGKLAEWTSLQERALVVIEMIKARENYTTRKHLLAEAYTWQAVSAVFPASGRVKRREIDVAIELWRACPAGELSPNECFHAVQALTVACDAMTAVENHMASVQFASVFLKFVEMIPGQPDSPDLWLLLADQLRLLGLTGRSYDILQNVPPGGDDHKTLLAQILVDDGKTKHLLPKAIPESDSGELTKSQIYLGLGQASDGLDSSVKLLKRLLRATRRTQISEDLEAQSVNIGGIDVPVLRGVHGGQRTTLLRLCHTLRQVALAHEQLESVEDAEYYLLCGSALARALNCPVSQSILLCDAGIVALRKGDVDTSSQRFADAQQVLNDIPVANSHFLDRARSYVSLRKGDELLEAGDTTKALLQYDLAEEQLSELRTPRRARKKVCNTEADLTPREKRFAGRSKALNFIVDRDGDWSALPIDLFSAKVQIRRCRAMLLQNEQDAQRESQDIFEALTIKKQLPARPEDQAAALFGFYEALVAKNPDEHKDYLASIWSLHQAKVTNRVDDAKGSTRSTRLSSRNEKKKTSGSTYLELLERAKSHVQNMDKPSPRLQSKIDFAAALNTGRVDPSRTTSSLAFRASRFSAKTDLEQSVSLLSLEDSVPANSRSISATLPELPENWTVVGLSLSACQTDLILWRLEAGATEPIVVIIDLPERGEKHSVSWAASKIDSILQELKRTSVVSVDAAESLTQEEKKNWWSRRFALDKQLGCMLSDLENSWMGHFRGLMLGTASDSLPCLGSENRDRLVRAMASVNLSKETISNASRSIGGRSRALTKAVTSILQIGQTDESRGPVALVLDKELQFLPWESMPVMQNQVASRVPDLSMLCLHEINPCESELYYLLNPGGDLIQTQNRFESLFERRPDWKGISGFVDSSSSKATNAIKDGIEKSNIFLFCGHNGAEQYMAPRELSKLSRTPKVAMLMGCSSGRLHLRGSYNPCGTAVDYLEAGCPCVVANIWDVTDGDIDRFTEHLLYRWIGVENSCNSKPSDTISLGEAVLEAREACKMKYLVGAATVVYGVPLVKKHV